MFNFHGKSVARVMVYNFQMSGKKIAYLWTGCLLLVFVTFVAGCAHWSDERHPTTDKDKAAIASGTCGEIVMVDASTQAQAVQYVFEYVRKYHPGAKIKNKSLRGEETQDGKRLFDVYDLGFADGTQGTVCFDISATIAGYSRTTSP